MTLELVKETDLIKGGHSRLPIIYDNLDKRMRKRVQHNVRNGMPPVSCAPGCNACCKQWVGVSYIEAEHMVREARRVGYQIDKDRLDRTANMALDRGMTRTKYFEYGEQCVFNDEKGNCGVWNKRPIACRAVLVVSEPQKCGKPDAKVLRVATDKEVKTAYQHLNAEHKAEAKVHVVAALPVMVKAVLDGKLSSELSAGDGVIGLEGETTALPV